MRILVTTYAPISAQFGASQVAINLAEALREQGHEVTLWSPHPMPNLTRWWQGLQSIQLMRSKLDDFLETQQKFDVIDCTSVLITKKVSRSALVVARSVQPEILYLLYGLLDQKQKKVKKIVLLPFNCIFALIYVFLLLQGWARSQHILCLGSLQYEWVNQWFPWWKKKVSYYLHATSEEGSEAISQIRLSRQKHSSDTINFLWIGRWDFHKGNDRIVSFMISWLALHPQDTFTIAGCGAAELDFPIELVKSGSLEVIPSFDRSQLLTLLASHDIGLFTSRVEGWGLVLNEMLEAGMPVFATNVGGVLDLQPFFREMLKPFPPISRPTTDVSINHENLISYFRIFTWKNIAETYVKLVSVNPS